MKSAISSKANNNEKKHREIGYELSYTDWLCDLVRKGLFSRGCVRFSVMNSPSKSIIHNVMQI